MRFLCSQGLFHNLPVAGLPLAPTFKLIWAVSHPRALSTRISYPYDDTCPLSEERGANRERVKPTYSQRVTTPTRPHRARIVSVCYSPSLVLPRGRPDRNHYLTTATRSVSSLDHTPPGYAFRTFTRRLPSFCCLSLLQELTNGRNYNIDVATTIR